MAMTWQQRWGALSVAAAAMLCQPAWPMHGAVLQAVLDARFKGDRSGACMVAALIDKGQLRRAKTCAQTRADGGPGYDIVFEIGSITKTMTAFLAAQLIHAGDRSPDDPIAKHLPLGTQVPRQGARQILVHDVLTHSSGLLGLLGLPPGLSPKNVNDLYADLNEPELLPALGKVQLDRAIGSQIEYTNFAVMLISLAVARSLGGTYEQALRERLFEPLQMNSAHIDCAPRRAYGAVCRWAGSKADDWPRCA
jgi:serine-type D-Ala-D-Ala carboxypeptidase/endopeptidase